MSSTRVLCIAAGGAGGDAGGDGGGGGAGGFRDVPSLALKDFTEYDVVVGAAVSGNGENSYLSKKNSVIETPVFSIGIPNTSDTEVADVSALLGATGEIWVEINVSGTQEDQNDGTYVTIEGVNMGITWDGKYHFDVTSLVSGKSTVTLYNNNNSCSATVTFKFSTGYEIISIGGGRGGIADGFGDWDEAETGKQGGSGGGGGAARNQSGSGGAGISGQGYAGGGGAGGNPASGGTPARPDRGGGGGGAGGVGLTSYSADGGVGKASDITGTSIFYAGGGGGHSGVGGNGQANAGGGGNGGESGNNGIIVVRYNPSELTHIYTGGTITEDGGDRIHTFTSSGTLKPFLPPIGAINLSMK